MLGTMRLKWVCAVVLGMTSVAAQQNPGSITGKVVDVTDAVIPNTELTLLSPTTATTTADAAGNFVMAGLKPGTYRLRVQKAGFWAKNPGGVGRWQPADVGKCSWRDLRGVEEHDRHTARSGYVERDWDYLHGSRR